MKRFFIWVCALLLVIGHLLPWAAHRTAPLTLSANDLGFFTNFTPGAGIFWNEWFYLPVWVAAVLLSLAGAELSLPNRLLTTVLVLVIASLGLPRYEQLIKFVRTPTLALRESDFTLQLVLTLMAMALVIAIAAKLTKPARFLKPGRFEAVTFGLASFACAAPLVGYLSIKPFIAELYHDVIGIGSGWWLTLLADLALWGMTFATIIAARSAHRTPNPTHPNPSKPTH